MLLLILRPDRSGFSFQIDFLVILYFAVRRHLKGGLNCIEAVNILW